MSDEEKIELLIETKIAEMGACSKNSNAAEARANAKWTKLAVVLIGRKLSPEEYALITE